MPAEAQRRHRQRIRAQGKTEILVKLRVESVETLDRLRAIVEGADNRSDVVEFLIQRATEAGNELKQA